MCWPPPRGGGLSRILVHYGLHNEEQCLPTPPTQQHSTPKTWNSIKPYLPCCFGRWCPPPSSAGRWSWKHIHNLQPREGRSIHTHSKPRWVKKKKKWKLAMRPRSNTINSERCCCLGDTLYSTSALEADPINPTISCCFSAERPDWQINLNILSDMA